MSFVAVLALLSPAYAQKPDALAGDYIRSDFTVEDGLPDNVVNAIVQTRNGLLWVGTESGLASFDGREFSPVDLQTSGSPSQGAVNALLESSNGDLWVGTDAGVMRIPAPALEEFNPTLGTFYHVGPGPSNEVEALLQTREGEIWAGTDHGLYRLDAGKFVAAIPGISVSRVAEALNGHLLIVTDRGFIEWDGREVIHHPGLAASLGVHDDQIFNVFQDSGGTMWYGTPRGIRERGARPLPALKPAGVAQTAAYRTYVDPKGAVWIATGIGVYRVDGQQLETPAPNVNARSFYADRDGELWLGTNGKGLVRLKPRVVHMFTSANGLPDNDIVMAVLSTRDGKLWAGSNCGFSVLNGTRFRNYREKDGLLNTCVWSLAEDPNGNLWIGTFGGGLFRFRDGHFLQYSVAQGLASKVVLEITVAHDGSLWMATPEGVSHMLNGRFRNYTVADGLSSNKILSLFEDRSDTVWAATQGGIDRLSGERFVPFSQQSHDGSFPIGFGQDSLGDLYVFESPKGISLIEKDRLIPVNDDLRVLGMVESPQHDLWFSGTDGIIRIRLADLRQAIHDRQTPLNYERFDRSDGLDSVQCSSGPGSVAITPDGKLWVATVKGVAMLDLAHLPAAGPGPRVLVGSITVGRHKELAEGAAVLPPGTHHVALDLEAVDLGSPEKVRLQYRLDGVDSSWLDADESREAVYTEIPVGTHAFHLRGTGSDGIWDLNGIVYEITQQPYFYQTTWFQVVAVTALFLLLTTAYLLRVQQIVRQAHMRAEERLMERERIAREMHDTLLQGILSVSMHLEAAHDRLPEDSPARPVMKKVLLVIRQVIEEGRNALRGLRTRVAEEADLAVAFSRLGQEFGMDASVGFRVVAQSNARKLRSRISDEVYRIGREAIMNAFFHAKAKSVEVMLQDVDRHFRLIVRDDGRGIDPGVLDAGREGHFGLAGMRERSENIGGTLRVRSRVGAGTEVELTLPQAIAFGDDSRGSAWHWLRRMRRTTSGEREPNERRNVSE